MVSEEEFYRQLCLLSPSESLIAKKMRAEYATIEAQLAINSKNEPMRKAIASAENKISAEIIVYNRLFEFLDRSNKNLVQ